MAEAITLIASAAADSGQKVEIRLVPQVTGPTFSEDDRPVLEQLAARLDDQDCVVEPQPQDVAAALETYGSFDFLLATRLHSAILSACVGTPFAVFGYVGGKAQGMVQDLGLPESTTTDRLEEIPATALRCYQNRDSLRSQIARGLPSARERVYGLSLHEPCDDS
jgi:polysaccharide pyruvyl transferase WcaK-like protein